jgi:hypothetical protein
MTRLLTAALMPLGIAVGLTIRWWWLDEDPWVRDVDTAINTLTIHPTQTSGNAACISTDLRQADDWGPGFMD